MNQADGAFPIPLGLTSGDLPLAKRSLVEVRFFSYMMWLYRTVRSILNAPENESLCEDFVDVTKEKERRQCL